MMHSFFIYFYNIWEIKKKTFPQNSIIYILNKISEELLINNNEIYSKGIWDYLNKYKTKYFDLTTKKINIKNLIQLYNQLIY